MTESTSSSSAPGGPLVNPHARQIVLAHGGGGQLTDELIRDVIRPRLENPWLDPMDDAAILSLPGSRVAITTDSYVVQPLEFPGGDIGRLAVCGTVNDLAACGATTAFISLGLILEEGLEMDALKRILDSAAAAADEAGVRIVTGDTKVVAHGQADGMYINTSGVGEIPANVELGIDLIQPGDVVIVSGEIADHGMAIMLQREQQTILESTLQSDTAPLNGMVESVLQELKDQVVFLRDPTRGGLAGVLSDLAEHSGYHLSVDETKIPVRRETLYAAEMLGLDPLDVANEGKFVFVVRKDVADRTLAILHQHLYGRQAAVIGQFLPQKDGLCELITDVGGRRIIQKPYGEELPRIC